MQRFAWAVLLVLVTIWGGPAGAATTAAEFVRDVGHEMPAVLGNAKTVEEKRVRLQPFIARVVDLPAVARFCLGHYWNTATPAQQQDYQHLFLSVLVNTIATWSGSYGEGGDQTRFEMKTPIVQPDGTYVPTLVQSGDGPAAHITWVINMDSQPPTIRDVVAEGISMRMTQRSDYVAYLGHHGGDIEAFIQVLRQRSHDIGGNPFASVPSLHPRTK